MNTQEIDKLLVLHRPKDESGRGLPARDISVLRNTGLFIDTCLRQVWISTADSSALDADPAITCYRGAQAYSFLLQTVTGLNSSVPGETNVAGQFRCAWKRWRNEATTAQANRIGPIMNRLFNDGKQIRQMYLQNLGGASYGTLTRKLLLPERDARILFVGSGKFALSLLPFFSNSDTGLWNHRLHPGLADAEITGAGTRVFSPGDILAAARWATHLVLTIPADCDNDHRWAELATTHDIRTVIHLARRRAGSGPWRTADEVHYFDLDHVFELRRNQSVLRDIKVLRARRACETLAMPIDAEQPAVGTPLPLRA